MLVHDVAAGNALGHGQLYVVGVELVHHITAHPHGVVGNIGQGQTDDGQNPGLGIAAGEKHGNAGGTGAVDLDKQIENHHGNSIQQHDETGAQLVNDTALEAAHGHAQGKAHDESQTESSKAEAQREGHLGGNDLNDGHIGTVDHGLAQITLEQVQVEILQLHRHRIQQTQLTQRVFNGFGTHLLHSGTQITLNGHLAQKDEDDSRNGKERQDRKGQAL